MRFGHVVRCLWDRRNIIHVSGTVEIRRRILTLSKLNSTKLSDLETAEKANIFVFVNAQKKAAIPMLRI